uniref:MADF domain-containing protein n=1 Tax=Haemonchus contortus TaxID=6289 RepID=A0A7I4YYT3_HAECO
MSYPAKILLIKLVRQHESIWNTRSPDYSRTDVKLRAWTDIAERMRANGFVAEVGRLKVMWKNLRDQWKRNIALKMPPDREWYFQRRINFLADTYEGGIRAHCSHYDMDSPKASPDALRPEEYSYFDHDYSIEGSSMMREFSPTRTTEPKSEMRDDGSACGPTVITIIDENSDQKMATVKEAAKEMKQSDNNPGIAIVSSQRSAPTPPPAKRPRTEEKNEDHNEPPAKSFKERPQSSEEPSNASKPSQRQIQSSEEPDIVRKPPQRQTQSSEEPDNTPRLYQRQTPYSRGEAFSNACTLKQRDKMVTLAKALKVGKNSNNYPTQMSSTKAPGDKFDKYAAFVSTTLREMPEAEAKRRMREMTLLLFEEIDVD